MFLIPLSNMIRGCNSAWFICNFNACSSLFHLFLMCLHTFLLLIYCSNPNHCPKAIHKSITFELILSALLIIFLVKRGNCQENFFGVNTILNMFDHIWAYKCKFCFSQLFIVNGLYIQKILYIIKKF